MSAIIGAASVSLIGERIAPHMRFQPLMLLVFLVSSALAADVAPPVEPVKTAGINFRLANGPDGMGALLAVDQGGAGITVQVPVPPRANRADVSALGLQVWLLKADGTVVLQQSADPASGMIGSGLGESWFVIFHFSKVPVADIIGIAFRKQGKLYSQEITAELWKR